MSATGMSGSNYLRAADTLSPALTSDEWVVLMFFARLASSAAGSTRALVSLGEASTNTHWQGLLINSGNTLRTTTRSSSTLAVDDSTSGSMTGYWDAWVALAVAVEGPHDGSSRAYRSYVAGSLFDNGTFTSQTYSTSLDYLMIGRNHAAQAPNAADKICRVACGNRSSQGAVDTMVSAHAAGTALGSIAGVAFGWDLVTNANATVGGVNLAAVGSGATFDADEPTFGGGGLLIPSFPFFFRHDTAQEQARRLGFIGWRSVVEL